MSKILHIKASPMGDLSFSTRTARIFLDSYLAQNPKDILEELDLWETDLPDFDSTAATGKYKIMRGLAHSDTEAKAWNRIIKAVDQFKSADKLVLSTGMWNFSLPYRLKQYLDIIIQPTFTFSYDPAKGYSGLVTGKPIQLILASGGEFPADTPMADYDFQKPYLELAFGFIGFTDIRSLRVEGTMSPAAEDNLAKIGKLAVEAAKRF